MKVIPIFPCRNSAQLLLSIILFASSLSSAKGSERFDVIVYSATPGGIAAAIAAASDGCSVLLAEPTHRIGGLVTSGLSHTDFHSRESLSGSFLDFANRVEQHYRDAFGPESQQVKDCFGGAFGEPKVNLLIYQQMLNEHPAIRLVTNRRLKSLELSADGHLIKSVCLSGENEEHHFHCSVAIDASYEGDLMAAAGVPWRVGREGRMEYGEALAPEEPDDQLQAYNFRFIMTKDPSNRVTPKMPEGYDRNNFVGVIPALQSGAITRVFDYPSRCIFKAQTPPLPNGKYDINDVSRNVVRLSLPGQNLGWPNGSLEERTQIFHTHLTDQAGLLYFLQNDAAVPERFQTEAREWGWCRDEFEDSDHLPPQLYIREARRMIGQHVYVQKDSEYMTGDARAKLHMDSIAMADYGNNCHGTAHVGTRTRPTHR
ncbi:MAG: FAD-dependent oxidoreductase [Planctomycetaceae bacterium]